jgi:serpin B
MNRRDLLSLSGALAAAALAGCAGSDGSPAGAGTETTEPPTGTTTERPTETPTNTPTETPGSGPNVDEERLANLAADNAAFALDLHAHLAEEKGGNQFLSPYSISVALAMTFAGTRGKTREQMRETLHYALGEDVHPAFADLEAVLESRETATDPVEGNEVDAFQLDLANAVWGKEGYAFAQEYLALLDEYYGAGLRRADFAGQPDAERERINEWVADATEDRIEDLLPSGSIGPDTVLVLTNAIYFMAAWLRKFDPEDTEQGTFTALDGSESQVPFMHQTLETAYASVDGAEAVELPYVGEEVSMVLMLPDEGTFETFERELDADRLFEIFDALGRAKGDLAMPTFEFGSKVQLKDALSALGMPVAFGGGADFSGMVEGESAGLWIDDVFHESFVSVDEEGTEASAATAVLMAESIPPEWGELRFDRPFLFCIRDRPTNAVLFLGRVVDAGAAQG